MCRVRSFGPRLLEFSPPTHTHICPSSAQQLILPLPPHQSCSSFTPSVQPISLILTPPGVLGIPCNQLQTDELCTSESLHLHSGALKKMGLCMKLIVGCGPKKTSNIHRAREMNTIKIYVKCLYIFIVPLPLHILLEFLDCKLFVAGTCCVCLYSALSIVHITGIHITYDHNNLSWVHIWKFFLKCSRRIHCTYTRYNSPSDMQSCWKSN